MNECQVAGKDKYIDFLSISILFLIIFFVNLPLANTELISPDASGYLDMGRNLFLGKGAMVSYNIYQFWPDRYHPFLPYTQSLFAIIAGLIYCLFNLKSVIGFNILLFAINCILLYKIIRLNNDYLTGFFIALFMGFSNILIFTAIFPWTEQLHLFFLLLAIFIYLRYEKNYLLIGIILATSCLVRVAGFYNIFAFGIALVILKGFSKKALKEYTKIALGFLTIFLFYEMFCYFRYGMFYPEYLAAAKTYAAAEIYPGAFYKEGFPILNMPPLKIGMDMISTNIRKHFSDFINTFGNMKFVFILVPLYIIYDLFKRKTSLLTIFFFQGIGVIAGYTLSLWWLPEIEATRSSLIPFITLVSIGFLSIKQIFSGLFPEKVEKRLPIVFIIIILSFLYFQIKNYLPFRNYYRNIYPQKYAAYRKNRDKIYEWIKTNTRKDALIASNFLADAFLYERPFVSLPPGKALTEGNLKDFLKIYRPQYIHTNNVDLINFLKSIGFVEKKASGPLVLLSKPPPKD